MITIDPSQEKTARIHAILVGAVGPRPVAFASTVDKAGNPNLSPFSFFNVFSGKPPIMVFSPARRGRDNTTKHTFENVQEVPEVVINVVSYDMVQQMSLSAAEYPKGVNEFIKSGFTPVPSEKIKPARVKESAVQFECRVNDIVELGKEGGAGNLVICEVLLVHVAEHILDTEGRIDPNKLDLVGRLGGDYYCRASGDALFRLPQPTTNLGMGVDMLPAHIRNSAVFTGNNLGQLANEQLNPNSDQLLRFGEEHPDLKKSAENAQGKIIELHMLAKEQLDKGAVLNAWCILAL